MGFESLIKWAFHVPGEIVTSKNSFDIMYSKVTRMNEVHLLGGNYDIDISSEEEKLPLNRERWVVLGVFCMQNLTNASFCFTFSAIENDIGRALRVSKSQAIPVLAWVFLLFYAPGSILSQWVILKTNYRFAFLLGGVLTLTAAIVRLLAFLILSRCEIRSLFCYCLLIFGQVLGGISQPFFFNGPSLIASVWFPKTERDIATAIATIMNPLGSALGQLIPTLIVGFVETSTPIQLLLLGSVQLCLSLLSYLFSVFFFKASPGVPPSASAAMRNDFQKRRDKEPKDIKTVIRRNFDILQNRDFRIILIVFGGGLAFFNALLTLVDVIIEPYGFSQSDAGILGVSFILAGIVGSMLLAIYFEHYQNYKKALQLLYVISVAFVLSLFFALFSRKFSVVLIMFMLLGFFMLPILPASIEASVQCTFPASEDDVTGILLMVGNTLSVPFIIIFEYLNSLDSHSMLPFTLTFIFSGIVGTFLLCILFQFDGTYAKMMMERENDDLALLFPQNEDAVY